MTRSRVAAAVVLIAGTVLLHLSFASPQGSPVFYGLSLALAVVWIAGGALVGPVRLVPERPVGWVGRVVAPVVVGLGLAAVFVLGATVLRLIPPLDGILDGVFGYADRGSLPLVLAITVLNAGAEELYFRGALWQLLGPRAPLILTTVIYALATMASGNPLLVFAAVLLAFVLGRLRLVSGAVLGPMLAHATWSITMLLAVPSLLR